VHKFINPRINSQALSHKISSHKIYSFTIPKNTLSAAHPRSTLFDVLDHLDEIFFTGMQVVQHHGATQMQ